MTEPNDNVEQRVAAFYAEQGMDPKRREALVRQMLNTRMVHPDRGTRKRQVRRYARVAIPLMLVLGIVGVFVATNLIRQANVYAIAAEIALNHRKQLDVDVASDQLAVLQQAMPKLDFSLTASSRPALANLDVLGARYCSIGKAIAAQLRLQDAEDRIYTLYQFRIPNQWLPDNAIIRIPASEANASVIEVKLWKENDLLLGLASAHEG